MLLGDYLNVLSHKRRILIVSDMSRGQALIRKHERQSGMLVRNINCYNIEMIVDILYKYFQAKDGYKQKHEMIDQVEAMTIFRCVLFDNLKRLQYFNNEKMLDTATIREIFNKVCLVRTNGWNKEADKDNNKRINDLKLLVAEYDNKLMSDNIMDEIEKEKYVLQKLRACNDKNAELNMAFFAEISYLADDEWLYDGVKLELLAELKNAETVMVYEPDANLTVDKIIACKGKAFFYKGYGSFNEAAYIANDIFERKLPFGSVTVLYSSLRQLPAILSALRGNGIKANVVTNHPVEGNDYISLAKRILAWPETDYSEKALEKILASRVMSVEVEEEYEVALDNEETAAGVAENAETAKDSVTGNEETAAGMTENAETAKDSTTDGEETAADDNSNSGKKKTIKRNVLGGQGYFDHVRNAANRFEDHFVLGWGYERNVEFIKHEMEIAEKLSVIEVLKMHEELINIFGEDGRPYDDENKVRPGTVFNKLTAFIKNYTYVNTDYAVGFKGIKDLTGAVMAEERYLSLKEAVQFISDLIAGITSADSEEDDAVTVQSIGRWSILERPNVYVTGLSLVDMQGNTTESPVLLDEEMSRCLNSGYIPTIINESKLREKNLLLTIDSFNGDRIVFGYSDYDTVGFCENNAAVFYREALAAFGDKDINDVDEFVYGNPSKTSKKEEILSCKNKVSCDVRKKTSSSAMEILLECPKKYAYSRLMYIPDNSFTECNYNKWLDARVKGLFFHEIAEKYCNDKLALPKGQGYEKTVDKAFIERIAGNIEKEMLLELPCPFIELADRETEEIIEVACAYFQEQLDELNDSSWRFLAAEQKFIEAEYKVRAYDGKDYDFEFSGFVDRIDYRIDKENQKCYIRIDDYKTGKREYKEKAYETGCLIQYAVYKKAVMETGKFEDDQKGKILLIDHIRDKVAILEGDPAVRNYSFEFECFRFVLPFDKQAEEPMVIYENDLEGLNMTRLKAILSIIGSEHIYPNIKELAEGLYALGQNAKANANDIYQLLDIIMANLESARYNCGYCEYAKLCNIWRG